MRSAATAVGGSGTSIGAATGGVTAAPMVDPVSTADPDPPSLDTPAVATPSAASHPAPAAVSDPDPPATSDPAASADPATPAADGLTEDNGISAGGPTEVDNVPGTASSNGVGSGVGTTGTAQVRSVCCSLSPGLPALITPWMARPPAHLSISLAGESVLQKSSLRR